MSNTRTSATQRTDFAAKLLAWYQRWARPLPWRDTNDPYAIWVSEAMLQQTRVETVIPFYHRFLNRFPTIQDLAAAPEEAVLKSWEGLGYYRRARLLQQGARDVLTRFNGKLPADPDLLKSIPGIGPYMAGALASIAFNIPIPAIDGNVIRVVTRILTWEEEARTARSLQVIHHWIMEQFPTDAAREFTQSLMELGALICLPKKPRCLHCPVQSNCQAAGNVPERYPTKKIAREIPSERRIILRIQWNEKHLLVRRPETGLLAGLWEYPNIAAKLNEDALTLGARWTHDQLGRILEFRFISTMTQVFTHRRWDLEIYAAEWKENQAPRTPPNSDWFLQTEEAALPRVAFVRRLQSETK